jgi:hypothetical protein
VCASSWPLVANGRNPHIHHQPTPNPCCAQFHFQPPLLHTATHSRWRESLTVYKHSTALSPPHFVRHNAHAHTVKSTCGQHHHACRSPNRMASTPSRTPHQHHAHTTLRVHPSLGNPLSQERRSTPTTTVGTRPRRTPRRTPRLRFTRRRQGQACTAPSRPREAGHTRASASTNSVRHHAHSLQPTMYLRLCSHSVTRRGQLVSWPTC